MRILVISDYLPYPLIGGDRIRIYNLLRRVASQHEVYLAAFIEKPEDIIGISHLEQYCVRVETTNLSRPPRLMHALGLLSYALQGKPMGLKFLHSEELVAKIKRLTSQVEFDIVQIEHSRMGLYQEVLPRDLWRRSILMFHNFTYQQHSRVFQTERRWGIRIRSLLNSLAMLRWEPRFAQRFGRCTTVSDTDRQMLLKSNPRMKVDVIPNGVDIQKYQPLERKNTPPSLMFIGNMSYPPCVDAVLYFCQEILPLIRQKMGHVHLWIVGRDPRPEVRQLDGNGVHVTGQVEEVTLYYQESSVCVVPLRAGGGTRLKILEAMALGRPVVSTTIGCEGLEVTDGEHLMIADSPNEFARKTMQLLNDRQLYQSIVSKGRKLVETHYSWDNIAAHLMAVYEEMTANASQRVSDGEKITSQHQKKRIN